MLETSFRPRDFLVSMPSPSPAAVPAEPAAHEQRELLRWVAELYYLQQQGQAEIAGLIGVSVSKVSRLLAEARRQGIVTITVAPSYAGASELERELAHGLGLERAFVAPARVHDSAVASRAAALTAARLLPQLLPARGAVGLSGGYTVAQMARALEPIPGADLLIVPLQGNWADGGAHLLNDQICREAAARLGGRALSLPAPMLVDRAATHDALLHDMSIRPVTERWADLAAAVVGVGTSPAAEAPGYPSVMNQLGDSIRADLVQLGVVGDLCARMFDRDGRFVEHEVSRRTLGISIAELRRVPRVIAVAAGTTKAESLLGAARTGAIHILITDQLTAESLLNLQQGS
jgi:DNA-binding transcriptional regulator LsrR (DeoR family)